MKIRSLLAALAVTLPLAAAAQEYPSKPIRILVGYTAGGAVDVVARTVGDQLAKVLGQAVVVENKPGANSNIAVRALADSPPDGYTLMLTANALAASPALYTPPPFDPEKEVAPIASIGRIPVVIATKADSEYKSFADLLKAAKEKPGTIQYATPGNGSTPHLAVEIFTRAAGIQLAHIPYKGGAQAITDVLGGQLPLVAVNALEVAPHAKAGKLRGLAVMSATRTNVLPDVPTIAESGYPGFEASVWYGLIAPAKTPKPILDKLHDAVQKALATNEVQKRISDVGGVVTPGSSADFAKLVHDERARYDKVVREGNIRPD